MLCGVYCGGLTGGTDRGGLGVTERVCRGVRRAALCVGVYVCVCVWGGGVYGVYDCARVRVWVSAYPHVC